MSASNWYNPRSTSHSGSLAPPQPGAFSQRRTLFRKALCEKWSLCERQRLQHALDIPICFLVVSEVVQLIK